MGNFKFYSPEEIDKIKVYIKSSKSLYQVATKISKETGRSVDAVYAKVREIARVLKNQTPTYRKSESKEVKQARLGIILPEGMTFEGTPKRVTLYSDHFRIYF